MFEKIEAVERRYEEISTRMTDPTVIGNSELLMTLMKEHREIEPLVFKFREYKKIFSKWAYKRYWACNSRKLCKQI